MKQACFEIGSIKCSNHSVADLIADIMQMLRNKLDCPRTINCINAHIFNCAWENNKLKEILRRSRVVAMDGMSIVWASRLFSKRIIERCNMTDAFRTFMFTTSFPKTKAVLIGCTQEIAEKASDTINKNCSHAQVIASLSGYMDFKYYRTYFKKCQLVDFVFIGMGTPKSEKLSRVISRVMPTAIVWHIGGGTIMFLAGQLVEAPEWMKKLGLQWLHRLILEPKRMWRRYLIGNMLFVFRCIYCLLVKKKYLPVH